MYRKRIIINRRGSLVINEISFVHVRPVQTVNKSVKFSRPTLKKKKFKYQIVSSVLNYAQVYKFTYNVIYARKRARDLPILYYYTHITCILGYVIFFSRVCA